MESDHKRAFIAVIISGLILFFWQFYFAPKAPVPTRSEKTVPVTEKEASADTVVAAKENSAPVQEVQSFNLSQDKISLKVNTMLELTDFTGVNTDSGFDQITGSKKPFKIQFKINEDFKSVIFVMKQIDSSKLEFENHDYKIKGNISIIDGKAEVKLHSPTQFKFVFKTKNEEKESHFRFISYFTDELENIKVDDEERGDSKIQWMGLDFDYHLFAVSFSEAQSFLFDTKKGQADFIYTGKNEEHNFELVFAKKEYDYLVSLKNNLKNSVDFGIWSIIAVPILRGIQFFYTLIPNYGLAIIFLTFLIRLLTFPLQFKSFKSMKKMQEIQPELTKLREKFKGDPQRMQKESMDLFKRAGANPLGGCLPLLLQMPLFFAFYKVLFSSVELVGAPFYFWITDLSHKDPYYVLPVLMSITMFVQQKITPATTADPVQQKILLFMPLIFGFIMKDLPSGLTLYIFVSTLLGIVQQVMVFKKLPSKA